MDKPDFRFLLLWSILTLGQTNTYRGEAVSQDRSTENKENHGCMFSNMSGIIHLHRNDFWASDGRIWILQSKDANWTTIQFKSWFNEGAERLIILVYTRAPLSTPCPTFVYDAREQQLITLNTNTIWIKTDRTNASPYLNCTSFDNDTATETEVSSTENAHTDVDCKSNRYRENATVVSIFYVFFANVSITPSCSASSLQPPANGRMVSKDNSSTLGSEIQIKCNAGFMFQGVSRTAICTVFDGELAWMGGENASCISICFFEPRIENAHVQVFYVQNENEVDSASYSYTIQNDTAGFHNALDRPVHLNDNTRQDDHLKKIRRVIYKCNEPYVLAGNNSLECSRNKRGIWTWSSKPPSCKIPDCSSVIRLHQASGALVNPSYPSSHLRGGQTSCRWDLNSPTGSTFAFSFVYLDLPSTGDSSLNLVDAGTARPKHLRHFSGDSRPDNFTSESSRVIVTYLGPESVFMDHKGFYLQFASREPQMQIQIEQLLDEPDTQDVMEDVVLTQEHGLPGEATLQSNRPGSSASSPPNNPRPTDLPSPRLKTTAHSKADDSSDTWKIAVGVTLPFLVLIAVLVSVYVIYRKKFPVRMIIGREFSKFNNPSYTSSRTNATLVREDAEDYFSNRQSAAGAEVCADFNPTLPNIHYDNRGFVLDEEDEEEAERIFLEKKAWLFKKSSSENEMKSNGETSSDHGENNESEVDGAIRRHGSKTSTDTDISEILGQQQVTPKPKPRGKKQADSESSESGSTEEGSNSAPTDKTNQPLASISSLENMNSSKGSSLDTDQPDGTSSTLRAARVIFNQPTFEEVVADIRARSRSMSVGNTKIVLRPRSQSVDLLKSARRQSVDDHAATRNFHSLVSPRSVTTETENTPKVTANIVDVQIRIQTGSVSSSSSAAVTEDSNTERKFSELDEEEEKIRSVSLSSVNSNPHLVTDLDESFGTESENMHTYGTWDRTSDVNVDEIKQMRFEEIKEEDVEVDHVPDSCTAETNLACTVSNDGESTSQILREDVVKGDFSFKETVISRTDNVNDVKETRENADVQQGNTKYNEIPAHTAEHTSSDQNVTVYSDLDDPEIDSNKINLDSTTIGDTLHTFVASATLVLGSAKNNTDLLQTEHYTNTRHEEGNLDEGITLSSKRDGHYQAQDIADDEEGFRVQSVKTTQEDDDKLGSSDRSTSDLQNTEKDVTSEDTTKTKKRLRFELPVKTQSPGSDDTASSLNSDSDSSDDEQTCYDLSASQNANSETYEPYNATSQKGHETTDIFSHPKNTSRKNIKATLQFNEYSDSESSDIKDSNCDEKYDDGDDNEVAGEDNDGSLSEHEEKDPGSPDNSSSRQTVSNLLAIDLALHECSSPLQSSSTNELSSLPSNPDSNDLPETGETATASNLNKPILANREWRKLIVNEVQLSDTSSNASSSPPKGNLSPLNYTEEENFNVDIQFRPDGKKTLLPAPSAIGGRFSRSGSSESEGEEFTENDISDAVRIMSDNSNNDNDDRSNDKTDTFASVGDSENANLASYQEGSDSVDQVSFPITTYRFRVEESEDEDIDV